MLLCIIRFAFFRASRNAVPTENSVGELNLRHDRIELLLAKVTNCVSFDLDFLQDRIFSGTLRIREINLRQIIAVEQVFSEILTAVIAHDDVGVPGRYNASLLT